MTDQELYDFHQQKLNSLDPELRGKMVAALRSLFHGTTTTKQIRELISSDPLGWAPPLHYYWGMAVRNALRDLGYTEAAIGIENLDDIWVGLVELAVKE